jgi:hypothetical protein
MPQLSNCFLLDFDELKVFSMCSYITHTNYFSIVEIGLLFLDHSLHDPT